MELLVVALVALIVLLASAVYRMVAGEWPKPRQLRWKALVVSSLAAFILLATGIQLVPYGRDHSNPPVLAEPNWDSPRTRELAVRACYDCHSNEVQWPWYSNIAPLSWLVLGHVEDGRAELNFSEWGRRQEVDEIIESIVEGEMPPAYYTIIQGELSDAEEDGLLAGLRRTLGPPADDD